MILIGVKALLPGKEIMVHERVASLSRNGAVKDLFMLACIPCKLSRAVPYDQNRERGLDSPL